MSDIRGYFQSTLAQETFDLIAGDVLGVGQDRTVHLCKLNPDIVLKFERTAEKFQNAMEWRVWEELKDVPSSARWLAPCISISPCGSVLVQKRTAPLRRLEMKKFGKLPKFLADVKMANFGMLDGRLVCHDYGFVRWSWDDGMRKVKW